MRAIAAIVLLASCTPATRAPVDKRVDEPIPRGPLNCITEHREPLPQCLVTTSALPLLIARPAGIGTRLEYWDGSVWMRVDAPSPLRTLLSWSPRSSILLAHSDDQRVIALGVPGGALQGILVEQATRPVGFTTASGDFACVGAGVPAGLFTVCTDGTQIPPGVMLGAEELLPPPLPSHDDLVVLPIHSAFGSSDVVSLEFVHVMRSMFATPAARLPGQEPSLALYTRGQLRRADGKLALGGMVQGKDGGVFPMASIVDLTGGILDAQIAFTWGTLVLATDANTTSAPGPAMVRDDEGFLRTFPLARDAQPGPPLREVTTDARAFAQLHAAAISGAFDVPRDALSIIDLANGDEKWRINDGCNVTFTVREMHPEGDALVVDRTGALEGRSFIRQDCRTDFPSARPITGNPEMWLNLDEDGHYRIYSMTEDGTLQAAELPWSEPGAPDVIVAN